MRNILKGFLEPKAETYILPDANSIESGEDNPLLQELDEWAELPETGPLPEEAGLDSPPQEEPVKTEPVTPVHYAQLQAELILSQAREEAQQILDQARAQAAAEAEDVRAGARDEGYREGYAQGTAKAMEDAIRDREATAARLEKDIQVFLEKASLAREEMLLQTRDELLDLCIAVAEKVVRVSLKSSSEDRKSVV